MEAKTEAGGNDVTECSHDDEPTIGMFGCFLVVYSLQSLIVCIWCLISFGLTHHNGVCTNSFCYVADLIGRIMGVARPSVYPFISLSILPIFS